MADSMSDYRFRLNWVMVGTLTLLHAGALAALFLFTWQALWIALALLWISGGLGHRHGIPPACSRIADTRHPGGSNAP